MAKLGGNKHLRASAFIGGLIVSALLSGCESEEGLSTHERQEAAMRDPFNYNPDTDLMKAPTPDAVDPTDITGGGTSELNTKALKRDLDAVFK